MEPLLFVDDVCAVNSSGLHVKSNSGSLRPNSRVVHGPLALAFARGTITWWRGKVVKPPNQTLVSLIEVCHRTACERGLGMLSSVAFVGAPRCGFGCRSFGHKLGVSLLGCKQPCARNTKICYKQMHEHKYYLLSL